MEITFAFFASVLGQEGQGLWDDSWQDSVTLLKDGFGEPFPAKWVVLSLGRQGKGVFLIRSSHAAGLTQAEPVFATAYSWLRALPGTPS